MKTDEEIWEELKRDPLAGTDEYSSYPEWRTAATEALDRIIQRCRAYEWLCGERYDYKDFRTA